MALFMLLRRFKNQEEVKASAKKSFALKYKNWYQRGIKELAEKSLYLAYG